MQEVIDLLLGPLGTLVFALGALFALWRKWWVPGWLFRDIVNEKNEWKEAALRGTRVAERAVTIQEHHDRKEGRD